VEISTQECGVITELSGFQILGECGFTGESRTATVAVKERAYAIQILSSTIERFSPQIQLAFYKNLARESSRKIGMANKIITRKTPEKSRRVPAAVRQRVEHIM